MSNTATTKSKAPAENSLNYFSMTIDQKIIKLEQLCQYFQTIAKKWVFQLEKGSQTGFMHWQCKIQLKQRLRWSTYKNKVADPNSEHHVICGAHITPCSDNGKDSWTYEEKAFTRVEGPWSHLTFKAMAKIPVRYREEPKWYPWQGYCNGLLFGIKDTRFIDVILDNEGNKGKSTWAFYHHHHKNLFSTTIGNDYKEMMQNCYGAYEMGFTSAAYAVDIPRAITENMSQARGMWAALESLKEGRLIDGRNHYKEETLPYRPHIFVFTNTKPDLSQQSSDRWRLWGIDKNMELYRIPLNDPILPEPQIFTLLDDSDFKIKTIYVTDNIKPIYPEGRNVVEVNEAQQQCRQQAMLDNLNKKSLEPNIREKILQEEKRPTPPEQVLTLIESPELVNTNFVRIGHDSKQTVPELPNLGLIPTSRSLPLKVRPPRKF